MSKLEALKQKFFASKQSTAKESSVAGGDIVGPQQALATSFEKCDAAWLEEVAANRRSNKVCPPVQPGRAGVCERHR